MRPPVELRTVGFSAEYEIRVVTIGPDGARTESCELFRLYQDTKGRTRLEGSTPAGEGVTLRFAFLTDSQTRKAVVLDLDTGKRLEQGHWPRLGALAGTTGQPPAVGAGVPLTPKTEDLGEAQVEGLTARGVRTTSGSAVVEVWTASTIDQPPLLVRKKEPSREETQRLFNIRTGDPDTALFVALDFPQ